MNVKFCTGCGSRLESGVHFCGQCGIKISSNFNNDASDKNSSLLKNDEGSEKRQTFNLSAWASMDANSEIEGSDKYKQEYSNVKKGFLLIPILKTSLFFFAFIGVIFLFHSPQKEGEYINTTSDPKSRKSQKSQDAVSNAYLICHAADATGLLSKPCEVSGFNLAIRLTMDANGSNAREICRQMVSEARSLGMTFKGNWKIEIYSPYSRNNTLAQCNL